MQRRSLRLGDRTIAYLDSSRSSGGEVVVLIHAFPLSASMWEAQAAAAPPGWRVIAPDLRGFGRSTLADGPGAPSIADYADDVLDLLAGLGVTRAVIGGLSMGGYVTFAILRRAPAIARAVVLADTKAGADSPEARANRRNMLATLDREGPAGVARDMLPKLLSPASLAERPDLESEVRQAVESQSPAAIRGAILRLMDRPDSTPLLASIHVPTLVLVGADDRVTPPEEARSMAETIAGSELAVIERSGHLSNLERPDRFSAVLGSFLSRL